MARFIIISFIKVEFYSCKKSVSNGVLINIENNSTFTIDHVKLVYDTTHDNFGTILPGLATPYIFFKSLPDAPAAFADSANKRIFARHIIPPNVNPFPVRKNGKYTLQIFPDPTLFYHYNARIIKN